MSDNIKKTDYRKLKLSEIDILTEHNCSAEDWGLITVARDFSPEGIRNCRFRGKVVIGGNVEISNIGSCIANYHIADGVRIENVAALEVSKESRFGCGEQIRVINETGGREIPLFEGLTPQIAYFTALYRERTKTIGRIRAIVERDYCRPAVSGMGRIGEGTRLSNCGVIRDVNVGEGAVIEGVQMLSNGSVSCTRGQNTYIGPGVKMYDFIMKGDSSVDNGALLTKCFIGEWVGISALTATHSAFFANSQCENGEFCNVFAGPFTVSHHQATLLIAGMFSFFNAGSAANQSNHLFKTGPVHQGIHCRGCKFGSDAYMMLPVLNGAYTTVVGRHKNHPDTEDFPYSYLIEEGGEQHLLPGLNLGISGTVRDIAKWPKRDRRTEFRSALINFEEHNPYITQRIMRGIAKLEKMEARGEAETYHYKRMRIRGSMLKRGLKFYRRAQDKFIGAMLADGNGGKRLDGSGLWIDAAGMFMPKREMNAILDAIDNGRLDSVAEITAAFERVYDDYSAYAWDWALRALEEQLGRGATPQDIDDAIEKGKVAAEKLARYNDDDRRKDCGIAMAVGYGLDTESSEDKEADFRMVRNF